LQSSAFLQLTANETLIDLTVVQNSIYGYEGKSRSIIRFEFRQDTIVAEERWALGRQAPSHSLVRLAVSRPTPQRPPTAYLAPTSAGGILAVKLANPPEIRHLAAPVESTSLKEGVHICADARNNTLFVTEPTAQRISEMNCDTGESTLVWTPTSPAALDSLGERYSPQRARPTAVAVYRTRRLIDKGILKPNSRSLLASDPSRVKPRTLLIADSGNFCIWKLVQLPPSDLLLDLANKNQLLAFLGSGIQPQAERNYHPTANEEENLRRYQLPRPLEISLSQFGDVLIRSDPEYPMILLRPATARGESLVRQEARSQKLDWSD